MRPMLLICVAVFAVAMFGVKIAAHEIVTTFGAITGVAVIAVMYLAARAYERR